MLTVRNQRRIPYEGGGRRRRHQGAVKQEGHLRDLRLDPDRGRHEIGDDRVRRRRMYLYWTRRVRPAIADQRESQPNRCDKHKLAQAVSPSCCHLFSPKSGTTKLKATVWCQANNNQSSDRAQRGFVSASKLPPHVIRRLPIHACAMSPRRSGQRRSSAHPIATGACSVTSKIFGA